MDPLNPAVPGTMAAIESLINKIGKPSFFGFKIFRVFWTSFSTWLWTIHTFVYRYVLNTYDARRQYIFFTGPHNSQANVSYAVGSVNPPFVLHDWNSLPPVKAGLKITQQKPLQTCPTDNLEAMKKNKWNVSYLGRKLKVPSFLRCQDIFATSAKLSKFTGGERCYRPEPQISSPGG